MIKKNYNAGLLGTLLVLLWGTIAGFALDRAEKHFGLFQPKNAAKQMIDKKSAHE